MDADYTPLWFITSRNQRISLLNEHLVGSAAVYV